MSLNRRASLPGASELFRLTQATEDLVPESAPAPTPVPEPLPVSLPEPPRGKRPKRQARSVLPPASGRVKHDQKITVYFSSDELFALEDAALQLKRIHGINLDRGRLVRTAVALALKDLEEHGVDSEVVAELTRQ